MSLATRWGVGAPSRALLVAALCGVGSSACHPLENEVASGLDPAAVQRSLIQQFSYDGPGVLLVDPDPVGGQGSPPAMTDERLQRLRKTGMDVDRTLADRLAAAFRDAPAPIEVPEGGRLRAWDGRPLETGPDGLSYVHEGAEAALLRLYPVGFSTDGTRALTFLDVTCGPRECGLEVVALLRRVGGRWVLEAQVNERES